MNCISITLMSTGKLRIPFKENLSYRSPLKVFVLALSTFTKARPLADDTTNNIKNDEGHERIKKQVPSDDFADARYGARLAFAIKELERTNRDVYVDWISAGFINNEIPTWIPDTLRAKGLARRSANVRSKPLSRNRIPKGMSHYGALAYSQYGPLLGFPKRFTAIPAIALAKSNHRFTYY